MTDRPKIEWTDRAAADFLRDDLLGVVSAAECREREREAWWKARTAYWCLLGDVSPAQVAHCDSRRDALYPSLLPASPPPLVLSTGEYVCSGRGGWQKAEESSRDVDRRGFFAAVEIVRTASDAEKLAAWLRAYGDEKERG